MEVRPLKSEFEELKPIKEKTIPEYCIARAKYYADLGRECWLVDGVTDEKRYFVKFDEETRKIGSAFYKLGLRKGDHVIYMIRDLCKVPLLLTGVWRANGIMRASYDTDVTDTILHRVKESNAKFIVCEEDGLAVCNAVAEQAGWEIKIITVNRSGSSKYSMQTFLEEDDGSALPELQISEEDPAVILCTSGTTGLPKGAVHTHSSLLYIVRNLGRTPFTLEKPNLAATKATHVSGTAIGLAFLAYGKTSVMVSTLTKDNIFKAAEKYRVGFAFAFPSFLLAMAAEAKDHDFSSIDIIFTAGVLVTPAIVTAFRQLPNLKDVLIAFGCTESLLGATNTIFKDDDERETPSIRALPDFSVGKPYPGTEIKIIDIDTLVALGPDQRGEICLKSPTIFHSYFLNPEATKQAFTEDGYFRTGDIGYYDANGFIYIVDRLKEIFKYYNDHISPTEIEDVIGKHPKVKEVCIVGAPDVGGHVPRAFVTVQPNSGPKQDVAEEIKAFANAKLAPYKHLRGGVFILDELPKGKTGKVSRQLAANLPVD